MKKITEYKKVVKGWGHESWLWNTDFCGKILHFNPGKRLSWHRHGIKEEFFYLQSGRILLKAGWDTDINKAEEFILEPGEGFHVPVGLCHQMIGLEESDLFEFSTHHEDSDSERIVKGD